MNRPLLLRVVPERVQMSLYYRYYRSKRQDWLQLYTAAPLKYVSGVKMDLIPGDGVSDSIAFTGLYEPHLTRRLVELGRQGGRLIDIGANIGYFSLLWCACNPQNECIAFEASPRNVDLLRRNISQSGLEERIIVMPLAAGASKGRIQFDVGPADQTGWGGMTLKKTDRSIEVEVVRVDEVVGSDKPVQALKVDIEGADTWALIGCERLLKANVIRQIWYEQNKPRMRELGISFEAAQDYLRSLGYKSRPLNDPKDDLVEWFATPM
jgi:FkbM family methyltransferase